MTGYLTVDKITPDGNGRFKVAFRIDSTPMTATVSPSALESFNLFRRAVAKQCGCWMRHDAERGGRWAKEDWAREIELAFGEGKQQ